MINSKIKIWIYLMILSAIASWADLQYPAMNGFPVVFAWFAMFAGWWMFASALIEKYEK